MYDCCLIYHKLSPRLSFDLLKPALFNSCLAAYSCCGRAQRRHRYSAGTNFAPQLPRPLLPFTSRLSVKWCSLGYILISDHALDTHKINIKFSQSNGLIKKIFLLLACSRSSTIYLAQILTVHLDSTENHRSRELRDRMLFVGEEKKRARCSLYLIRQ